jgi:signal transduction histidine kinase/ligand-binding sensor domain-containing protein
MNLIRNIMIKTVLLLCAFLSFLTVSGQGHAIFDQITTNDGLSNGTVNSILRDSKGFMWFCTDDGLNRYDGFNFKIYQSEARDKVSGRNIQFNNILEDSFGHIWIGTSEGLYFLDSDNDKIVKFTRFIGMNLSRNSLNIPIMCLFFDSFHYLWAGTYEGAIRLKISDFDLGIIKSDDISFFRHNPKDSTSISNDGVFSFCEDHEHQLWISTFSEKLDCYNYNDNKFSHHEIKIPNLKKWVNLSKRIKLDNNDDIWIATKEYGIIYWDRGKDKFTKFNSMSNGKESIDTRFIKSIMIDHLGRIWFGTDGNGIVVLDKQKNEIIHFHKDKNDQSNLNSNAIYSIYEDTTGIYWIGTYISGINKLVTNRLNFGINISLPYSETGLSYNIVTSFCEDKDNKIWICTDGGGLNLFNRKINLFKHYKHNSKDSTSLSINSTVSLFCDRDNKIWVGTYNGGLNCFDQETQKFTHYIYDPNDTTTISGLHPWSIIQDKWGNMWIGTIDQGLNLLKPGKSTFVRYSVKDLYSLGPDYLISNSITQLFIDKNNRMWIATESGLDFVDLNVVDFSKPKPKLLFRHFLHSATSNSISENRISCINEDNNGNLWIGTKGSGLNKLDLKTFTFTNYTTKEGLPHNIIDGILIDNDNNLWISTNNGLSNFNVVTGQFKNYYLSDGLQSNVFVRNSCLKTHDGLLLFGGINGFNAFYPDRIISYRSNLQAVITGFKLFNQSVALGENIDGRVLLPKSIYEMNEIILKHNQNTISFEFTAMDYSNPERNLFSYKLDGFEKEWQITDAKMRIARYTNLNPGKYTFLVKASTDKDIWTGKVTSISIIIQPPWWKTLWFNISVIIMLVTFWIAGFSMRIYRLEKQKKILETTVSEKTRQLRESNVLKDKFLSIIAHDLINPFNSILGFSDLLLTNYSDWDDHTRIETIRMINDSSNNLFELLGNLLQWSRSERGLLEYSPEKIDLKSTVTKITSLLSITAKAKNISLNDELVSAGLFVKSDFHLLNTIIRNLISNSIKFTPDGGTISIKAETKNKEIVVSVIDNGVGISKERLNNLFNIGINQSTEGTNNEKGTGLGLILVKEFVNKQGGTLNIESEVGKGSAFSFTIPLWSE